MLSIIIPTFNEERYLPLLLESIANQDHKEYEVIIADAGSTDDTLKIAKAHGCRIVKGGLPAAGRNNGAKAAKGDIFLFLDADVILPWDFLRKTIPEFTRRELDVATCFFQPLTHKNVDHVLHKIANQYMKATQKFYPHAPGFCIFSTRTMFRRIGGFNERLKLAEDHEYIIRAAKIGSFGIITSQKILVSVRRLDKDGRFNISAKYASVEMYRVLMGEITTDVFKYEFGHGVQKKMK